MSGLVECERMELLELAESWTEEQVEAEYQQLLHHIHSLLADEYTSPELR